MRWSFFSLLCVFELIADVYAKKYALQQHVSCAVLAIVCYVLGNTAWVIALREGMLLSVGAVLFGVTTGVVATVVGVGFYAEEITRAQMIGLLLGLAAIGFLVTGES